MWTPASALLLLLACCLRQAEAQRQSIWEDPIKFSTKGKDSCTMIITGQGAYTKLRLPCQSNRRSYWCEYTGQPHWCAAYNKNPRHYFVQLMWGLRKLQNACQGPRVMKAFMCRKATEDSHMVFSSASFPPSWPEAPKTPGPAAQPAGPQPRRPGPARTDSARQPLTKAIRVPAIAKPSQEAGPQPTAESPPNSVARRYCWRSLQGVCAFVIGLFRN